MKINQIIHKKRKELTLTQEQIAQFLGVSTPAVNKWEKAIKKLFKWQSTKFMNILPVII